MLARLFRVELVSTVLLAAGTLATSWSGYQATRWSGVQAEQYSQVGTARAHSSEMLTLGGQHRTMDIVVFSAWLNAFADDRLTLADFYRRRFRPEFTPAFDEWIRSKPRENPDAAPTPFALKSYRVAAFEEAARLEVKANESARLASDANQQADDYVLATVLFAMVMFFAGIGQATQWRGGRITLLALAALLYIVGIVHMAQYPIE